MMRSQFLILAVFLVAWLLTLFLQYLLKRAQSNARQEVDPKAPPSLPREPISHPPRVMAPRAAPLPTVEPLVLSRQRARSRLGSLREVRRGIVLMTILSPCRALEPPEGPEMRISNLGAVSHEPGVQSVDDQLRIDPSS